MFQMLIGKNSQMCYFVPFIIKLLIIVEPNIYEIPISMVFKYPYGPIIHDILISVISTYIYCHIMSYLTQLPDGHTCHMWSHLSHVITLVTCGHTNWMLSNLPHEADYQKFCKMAPHPTFETMIRWLIHLHLFAISTYRPVAYHFCLYLPTTFSQPRTKTFSPLCT